MSVFLLLGPVGRSVWRRNSRLLDVNNVALLELLTFVTKSSRSGQNVTQLTAAGGVRLCKVRI